MCLYCIKSYPYLLIIGVVWRHPAAGSGYRQRWPLAAEFKDRVAQGCWQKPLWTVKRTRWDCWNKTRAYLEPKSLAHKKQRSDVGGGINIALPDLVMTVSSSRVHSPPALNSTQYVAISFESCRRWKDRSQTSDVRYIYTVHCCVLWFMIAFWGGVFSDLKICS